MKLEHDHRSDSTHLGFSFQESTKIWIFIPNSSPVIHPAAQMSTAVVWYGAWSKISGALYHSVTTFWVISPCGKLNHLANPKSAVNSTGNQISSRIYGAKLGWKKATLSLMKILLTNFHTAFIRHKKIGNLEITVHNEIVMKILKTTKYLNHYAFHLWFRERSLHVVQQACEVLLTVLHHQENAANLRFV